MCIDPKVPITTLAAARLVTNLTKVIVHHLSSIQMCIHIGSFICVLQEYFMVDRESHMDMLNAVLDGVADPRDDRQQTRLDFFRDLIDFPSHPMIGTALKKLTQQFCGPWVHRDIVSDTITELRILTKDEPIRWTKKARSPSPWLLKKSGRQQLKKRRRAQTPEEQRDDRDEEAFAQDEEHVSKRRNLEDSSPKESSSERT